MREDPAYQEVDPETAEVIGVMMGMENEVRKYAIEGGTINMCTGLRDLLEDSKAEGMALCVIDLLIEAAPISDVRFSEIRWW